MRDSHDAFAPFEALGGERDATMGGDESEVDLDACELVAQTYDTTSGQGTRLYHVDGDRYALSHYAPTAGREWTENTVRSGRLVVEPVALADEPLRDAVREHDAPSLSTANLEAIQTVYSEVCTRSIWERIDGERTDEGPVVRGPIACVEDHTWRETLRPQFAAVLEEGQVDAVLDGLMEARPAPEDWHWCQLYAVYVARLDFYDEPAEES